MEARPVGIDHVAIEVGDIDEALAWYGRSSISPCAARASATVHRHGRRVRQSDAGPTRGETASTPASASWSITARRSRRAPNRRRDGRGSVLRLLDPGNRIEIIDYRTSVHQGAARVARHGPQARQRQGEERTRREGWRRNRLHPRPQRGRGQAGGDGQDAASLIVRGQDPTGDIAGDFRDDMELVRRQAVGFDGTSRVRTTARTRSTSAADTVSRLLRRRRAEPAADLRPVSLPLHNRSTSPNSSRHYTSCRAELVFGCGIGDRDVS